MTPIRFVVAFLFTLVSIAAVAADAPPTRVRAVVVALDGDALTVKSREGETLKINLPKDFPVTGVVPATLADIAPGKFIGTAAMQQGDKLVALEVLIFPEAMRGFGEGHYPWDLQPGSNMTNATVSDVVTAVKDRVLTLKYKDGEKKITVPEAAPIVTFAPADRDAVKPGAHVFLAVSKQADGSLTAPRVTVGLNGLKPPM